jgi:acyl-lipid omega-6 desaturase (Delta-12 desaturase)
VFKIAQASDRITATVRGADRASRFQGRVHVMHAPVSNPRAGLDTRALVRDLAKYRGADSARSVFELTVTAVPLVLIWAAIWASLDGGYWIGMVLTVPAAGFLVRLFMIQHDCGHGAFFRSRRSCDWVGRVIGVFTLTPYEYWRRTHSAHHATAGNLDRRGMGDITTLTVGEYTALSWWGRLGYRLYRHPAVMFGLGPAYTFLCQHRLPVGLMRGSWQPWVSTMGTNLAAALLAAGLMWLIGVGLFLLIHIPIILLSATTGIWLFYVQHQFEATIWESDSDWRFHEAALHGSSHYALPGVLRWFTGNIGVHHVHHLASRIPCYRLQEVLRDHPELGNTGRITLLQSLGSVRLVLWDEEHRRLISFRQMYDAQSNMKPLAMCSKTVNG